MHENVVKVTHRLLMKASGLESGKKLGPPLPVSVTRGTGRYFIWVCRLQGVHRFLPNQDKIWPHIHNDVFMFIKGIHFLCNINLSNIDSLAYRWIYDRNHMGNIVSRENAQKNISKINFLTNPFSKWLNKDFRILCLSKSHFWIDTEVSL